MSRRKEKTEKIIATTASILRKEGIAGLSMRKVAKLAEIRLSNVQYYYKDRAALLEATIVYYFKECERDVQQNLDDIPVDISLSDLIKNILEQALMDGNTSERCAMFREIWALASKYPNIAKLVQRYYQQYNQWLMEQFRPYSSNAAVVVSILMPYVEGYSLMGNALPLAKDQIIDHLLKVLQPHLNPLA